jgi:hypothetical protein
MNKTPSKYFADAEPIINANARITLLKERKRAIGLLREEKGRCVELEWEKADAFVVHRIPSKLKDTQHLLAELGQSHHTKNDVEASVDNSF